MLIEQIQIKNLLGFGPYSEPTELEPLDVLIGPTASGKSNFLEALALLQAAPDQITRPIRDGGGLTDWLHKSSATASQPEASIESLIVSPGKTTDASERTQVIATTHAPALIDALFETPESVLVCERRPTGTHIERLDAANLKPRLASLQLGELWTRSEIGGTRW